MRVIVAEEDARFRNVLADLLRGDGHDVELASSGAELVALVRAHEPDALVAHARLIAGPVLDALVRIMSKSTMRTIVMSGAPEQLSRSDLARLGGVRVLDKPFSFERLRDVLGN
jgi:two-component system response regulator MprA